MGDAETNIRELKDIVRRYCEARNWDQFHDPKELAIGVSTEASELLEPFRFKSPAEVKELFENPQSREKIEHEAADVLYFLLRFAQRNNIDLSDALRRKIELNEKRYPVDKAKNSNKKYTEL